MRALTGFQTSGERASASAEDARTRLRSAERSARPRPRTSARTAVERRTGKGARCMSSSAVPIGAVHRPSEPIAARPRDRERLAAEPVVTAVAVARVPYQRLRAIISRCLVLPWTRTALLRDRPAMLVHACARFHAVPARDCRVADPSDRHRASRRRRSRITGGRSFHVSASGERDRDHEESVSTHGRPP